MRATLFTIALLTLPAHAGELLGGDIYQSMKAAKSSSIRAGKYKNARAAFCAKRPRTCEREAKEDAAALEEKRNRNRNAHREEQRRAQLEYERRQRARQMEREWEGGNQTVISR